MRLGVRLLPSGPNEETTTMRDVTDPMPGDQQDYSPEFDEEKRRAAHMKLQPKNKSQDPDRDEEADRLRRMRGGGGMGGD